MSFFGSAKEFFGLGPVEHAEDDAYYDDAPYRDAGTTAYEPSEPREERESRYSSVAAPRTSYRPSTQIVNASPRNYNDAKEIGEPFRDGDAVIMDLTGLETADAKRIVDFAAGLCFALRGNMHNLTRGLDTQRRVFAIVPENATVDKDDLKRAARL